MKILKKLILAIFVMPIFGSLQVNAWHCHNSHHKHVHHCAHHNSHNCANQACNNNHAHNCHNHGWASKSSVNFGFSINTPVYRPVYEPVTVVKKTYVRPVARPVTKITKTYTKPACEIRTYSSPVTSSCTTTYTKPAAYSTTTYSSYGYPYYGVCGTSSVCETVYSSPVVYETVSISPAPVVYETVEYRSCQNYQHPVSAAFNFASALVDAFVR